VSGAPAERTVLVLTRDLFFRAKLEAVVRAAGHQPASRGQAPLAVVELSGEASVERIRELARSGCSVLAFGSHLNADLLRAAREAGAEAVPNSQVEAALRRRLAR
jgi:predicted aminopeptidase